MFIDELRSIYEPLVIISRHWKMLKMHKWFIVHIIVNSQMTF